MEHSIKHILRAQDLFSSLRHEDEQNQDRKFVTSETSGLASLIKGFHELIISDITLDKLYTSEGINKKIFDFVPKDYSNEDIQNLMEKLLNNGSENIFPDNIDSYIDCVFLNYSGKEIIIDPSRFKRDYNFGALNQGKIIIVNGDCGDHTGVLMDFGKIIVNGNAGMLVGNMMKGGEIYLNKDYIGISCHIRGGNIYHKGTQIIKDGKPVPGAEIKWR